MVQKRLSSRLGVLALAVVVLSMVGVAGASAKTPFLLLTAKGPVPDGGSVTWAFGSFEFNNGGHGVHCGKEVKWFDKVHIIKKTKGEDPKEYGGAFREMNFGECEVPSSGMPAEVTSLDPESTFAFHAINTKGTGTNSGRSGKFALRVSIPSLGSVCVYEVSKYTSSFTIGAKGSPVPVELTAVGQKFKINKAASSNCPKEGKTTASSTATLFSEEEPVEAEL